MITDIDGLCSFLREYHREWVSGPAIPASELPSALPDPLARFYQQIGRLTEIEGGQETAWRAPLGTQDSIASPTSLKRIDGMIEFVWENQDCFSCRTAAQGEDPPVYSDWLHELGESEEEFEIVCDTLTHFLITFGLREAVMSSRFLLQPGVPSLESCAGDFKPLWINGVYVNRRPCHSFYFDTDSESIFMDSDAGFWLGSHRTDPTKLLPESARPNWITKPAELGGASNGLTPVRWP